MTNKDLIDLKIPYQNILNRLNKEGFDAYLVGGAIRDYLLGREIFDIDIATSARPSDIEKVFYDKKLISIGKKFGTIKVVDGQFIYEITTFRADGPYIDQRHPKEVHFSKSLREDLLRRDFTINAMALGKGGIIDPFSAGDDLKKKIIRAVGDPDIRIREDLLRSLRAVRFACQLDFAIEKNLKVAIKKHAKAINQISKERIRDEISKILLTKNPSRGLRLLEELGLLEEIFPEVSIMVGFDQKSSHHHLDLFDHSLEVLDKLPRDLALRLAGLFHDTGKPLTMVIDENGEGRFFGHQNLSADILEKRLRKLRFSNNLIKEAKTLVARHMDSANTYTKKSIRKLLRKLGEEGVLKLFDLQRADTRSSKTPDLSNMDLGLRILREIKEENIPIKTSNLPINGHDLKALGLKEGPLIGKVLDLIGELIVEGKIANDKKEILDFVTNKFGDH
ncbi:MAG: HD domain-containing protein [Anaerococcus sp.]|nr:HD domain-containing protein [Anaerococcus sp.]